MFKRNIIIVDSTDWRWIDGFKIDFSYWTKGQPDSKDKSDYCALSWFSGGDFGGDDGHWDDQPCADLSHPFVCQKEKSMKRFSISNIIFATV